MTTYYILPIKAELFYIFFMETVPSHKLKDATVWDIFLVVLCSPASSGAVSGFSGEYIKSRMHTGSSRSSRQARGMVWLNFPRSKLYRKVMNQNSCTVVCDSAIKTIVLFYDSWLLEVAKRSSVVLELCHKRATLESRSCLPLRVYARRRGVELKVSWKLVSGKEHWFPSYLCKYCSRITHMILLLCHWSQVGF